MGVHEQIAVGERGKSRVLQVRLPAHIEDHVAVDVIRRTKRLPQRRRSGSRRTRRTGGALGHTGTARRAALIAATCLEQGYRLATANVADFDWIEELKAFNPLATA